MPDGNEIELPASAEDPRHRPASSRILPLVVFVLAFAVRLLDLPRAFDHGNPLIPPVDDLYHWKRIAFSAAHFPAVLELDGDRGTNGAFCPWPPAYDLLAGIASRLLGAKSPDEVLRRVVWFPPLLFALFAAVTAHLLRRSIGPLAAAAAAIALATSPFLVTASSVGNIDHHFLEPPLTFAILASTCLAITARDRRASMAAGLLLAFSLTAAMFVQTALLLAAGLAFVSLFLFTDGLAAAVGFSIAACAVVLNRVTRTSGYPDNQWFLGWIHAALFLAAAVTAVLVWRGRKSRGTIAWIHRALALAAGSTTLLLMPSAAPQLVHGLQFLGGDRWLRTILEFQPMWKAQPDDLWSQLAGLSGGAVLVWFLAAKSWRDRDRVRATLALFAIAYLLLTITSRRFWIVAIPLLAVAGAVYASTVARQRMLWLCLALIAVPPPLQFMGWMTNPLPLIQPLHRPWMRAAQFLSSQPPGVVLCPWSMGHAVDVIGHHAVLIDNFGTMPDAALFERAHEALLAPDESSLLDQLHVLDVHYLILEDPLAGIRSANAILGTHRDPRTTFWWRLWQGESSPRLTCIWQEPTLRMYRVRVFGTPASLPAGPPASSRRDDRFTLESQPSRSTPEAETKR